MLRALLALIAASLLFALPAQAETYGKPLPQPKLLAVYFYADWCPNCKVLSPQFDSARSIYHLDQSDLLIVKMDLTNKDTIHQSVLLASALGIGDFVKAQGSATGYIAVLDGKTKKELIRFDRMSRDDFMGIRLNELLAAK